MSRALLFTFERRRESGRNENMNEYFANPAFGQWFAAVPCFR